MKTPDPTTTSCYHCGEETDGRTLRSDGKTFCCQGCQSVYEILRSNELCSYYTYNAAPGKNRQSSEIPAYLADARIAATLLDYQDDHLSKVTFFVPGIHCSSCIWLLEGLHRLNPGILHSRTDFLKREVKISFDHRVVNLKEVADTLAAVGYPPLINLQDVVRENHSKTDDTLVRKIAVAGFCVGNVMLFSFPEYFGLSPFEGNLKVLFSYLNLALSIPVVFYCGRDFFTSALAGIRQAKMNLDAPLALIISTLFLRTLFEVVFQTGPGFADTLTGLVFLLLMGRYTRQRSYRHLSFNRDYRSYFPLAVTTINEGAERVTAVSDLQTGDRIRIRSGELVPADALLLQGAACLDMSFVTGESAPVTRSSGTVIYAGARQTAGPIELEILKPVQLSYLMSLWNDAGEPANGKSRSFNDRIAAAFSLVVVTLAVGAAAFWYAAGDQAKAWSAFTAVIIVACPCVLALSTPFTLSAVLSVFDKWGFYLKNTDAAEQLANCNEVVFDKTGTLTTSKGRRVNFSMSLTMGERQLLTALAACSLHPVSRQLCREAAFLKLIPVEDYKEVPGRGISGTVAGHQVCIGNADWVFGADDQSAGTHLLIDGAYKGSFSFSADWREGIAKLAAALAETAGIHVLSGDTAKDRQTLKKILPPGTRMRFGASPHAKLDYIASLQQAGRKVIMLGDGLNDAGALRQSDFGIAVTEDVNAFSPGCHAIMKADALAYLPRFAGLASDAMRIIKWSFVISSLYNCLGLYFAVQGTLYPLVAAVLMPLSTLTIVIFTSTAVRICAAKRRLSL
ncbi:heavy metal translocating P-type ATPase [Pedobacter yulinensis]|uniref:Heavy metal translocating P-type ATPase n=1 Tax=Pedobacter yulinensis TaxID=2126353 RepID=A0A2T3HJZ8_9SPHI|nr:heavy metal translocating P-type ATPase metal-binding domain-containing protein [Pedobacter yulinensis]PST82767.1 heavy metal translocating P-type ATPase [Pedobacter yulinensis]